MALTDYEKSIFIKELEILCSEYLKCLDSKLRIVILEDILLISCAISIS
ncbi:hypothetical protein BCI9360_02983 [Bacillus sp. CECT 9360]|nr:hypothetical protein BCI9360_02983 [Bacillus sp. CECT 9360]